jgi:hypothetical protein
VSQNKPPFLCSKGWKAMLRPTLDFIEEQEIMIIVDTLVWGLTTPEEINQRKHEATM